MSKENFKNFAKLHPELATKVLNNETTWQKLYELYDIYGENSKVWDKYFTSIKTKESIKELLEKLDNLNVEKIQNGITSIQQTISLIQNLTTQNKKDSKPLYTYFEDNE